VLDPLYPFDAKVSTTLLTRSLLLRAPGKFDRTSFSKSASGLELLVKVSFTFLATSISQVIERSVDERGAKAVADARYPIIRAAAAHRYIASTLPLNVSVIVVSVIV
jgi:hypothetical protein